MPKDPQLRFDHKEIAVIFCLFVFVSLLMFTVGILVGKGLTQAKYEGYVQWHAQNKTQTHAPTPQLAQTPSLGTSVTTDDTIDDKVSEKVPEKELANQIPSAPEVAQAPLKLIPQKEQANHPLKEPPAPGPEVDKITKDPKLSSLIEPEPGAARKTASIARKSLQSFSAGKFTVQVGSYPTEQEATDRVEALKNMGFPHAYLSRTEFGDKKDTWYRVWLGYFQDFTNANESGRQLQERGEVKNYLVRKTDSPG